MERPAPMEMEQAYNGSFPVAGHGLVYV